MTPSADVQNVGSGNQGLNSLTVTIASISGQDATYSSESDTCPVTDFALVSASGSGWVLSNNNDTATYANTPAQDVVAGDYVTSAADSGGNTATGTALPSGLTATLLDLTHAQDQCQGDDGPPVGYRQLIR